MAQDTITAHIKLPDTDWQSLGNHARNHDLSTAQLVRRVLRGWLDSQVFVSVTDDGPVRAQSVGHCGYNPRPDLVDNVVHLAIKAEQEGHTAWAQGSLRQAVSELREAIEEF